MTILFTNLLFLNKGGVLFKGNLRGKPAKSYEKITNRLQVITNKMICKTGAQMSMIIEIC